MCRQFTDTKIVRALLLHFSDLLQVGRYGPLWSKIFCTHPEWPWVPPRLLYNGCSVSFLELKWLGCCVHHPPYSSTEVKERVQLYLYSPLGLYGLFQVKLHLLSVVTSGLFKVV